MLPGTFKVSLTAQLYRSVSEGFLKYSTMKGDPQEGPGALLVGPPQFAREGCRSFCVRQSEETVCLLEISTDRDRTYAWCTLAYSLGLRPAEISKITMDDISFQQGSSL